MRDRKRYFQMNEQEKIGEIMHILFLLGNDNIIFRLCYNLMDYASSGRRDYKPFEAVIKAFDKFEKTL